MKNEKTDLSKPEVNGQAIKQETAKKADFTRTIYHTTIKCAEVTVKEGKAVTNDLKPIIINGTKKISQEAAMKLAKKEKNTSLPIVILAIEETETIMGMTLETFLENSFAVERPASQQK